jgi:hypothetical protein
MDVPSPQEKEETKNNKRCSTCHYWRPHLLFPWIGYCTLHSKLTLENESCKDWKPISFNESDREFFWCLTCRRTVHRDEVPLLLRAGHRIYIWVYVEPDIREEIVVSSLE